MDDPVDLVSRLPSLDHGRSQNPAPGGSTSCGRSVWRSSPPPLSASDRLLPAVRRISDPETSFDRGRTLCVNRPGQAIRFHSGSKSAIRPVLTPELTPDGCERSLPHPPHEHTFGFVAVSHSSSHFRLNFVVRLVNFVSVSC